MSRSHIPIRASVLAEPVDQVRVQPERHLLFDRPIKYAPLGTTPVGNRL